MTPGRCCGLVGVLIGGSRPGWLGCFVEDVGRVVVLVLCAEVVLDDNVPGVLVRDTIERGGTVGVASGWRFPLEE